MLEALQEIDAVRLNFNDESKIFLNITIAIIMFGVALELNTKDFKRLIQQPRIVIGGILSQFVLMPALTFLIAISLVDYITPTVGLGMILVAACPGGNISNFMSTLAKGNVALSVSLTAFSSVGAIFLTPFNFAIWGNWFLDYYNVAGRSDLLPELQVDVYNVFVTIAIILAIPLTLGLIFKFKFKDLTRRFKKGIKIFSIIAFSGIVVIIFVSNYDLFLRYIKYIFILVLIHNAMAFLLGYGVGRAIKLPHREKKTIAIETGIQNSGLALALLFNPIIFPPELTVGGMAFIAAWWGLWHIIAGLTVAGYWSRDKQSEEISEG